MLYTDTHTHVWSQYYNKQYAGVEIHANWGQINGKLLLFYGAREKNCRLSCEISCMSSSRDASSASYRSLTKLNLKHSYSTLLTIPGSTVLHFKIFLHGCTCYFWFLEHFFDVLQLGSTAIGIQTSEGVCLAVEKRITSSLMEPSSIEKIVEIDAHIGNVACVNLLTILCSIFL